MTEHCSASLGQGRRAVVRRRVRRTWPRAPRRPRRLGSGPDRPQHGTLRCAPRPHPGNLSGVGLGGGSGRAGQMCLSICPARGSLFRSVSDLVFIHSKPALNLGESRHCQPLCVRPSDDDCVCGPRWGHAPLPPGAPSREGRTCGGGGEGARAWLGLAPSPSRSVLPELPPPAVRQDTARPVLPSLICVSVARYI